jgi:LPXTG-site transpeptidase (sortase) family protein
MKYIKFMFLGVFVFSVFLPSLFGNHFKIQRVAGEIRSNQVMPNGAGGDKIDGIYDYLLFIPKIEVDAPVLGLGLEPDGKMDVPDNYNDVGWYSLGTAPGEVGNAVLGAHVDNGADISGVFKNIKRLEIGDDIYTTDNSKERLRFKITKIERYDYQTRDTGEVFGNTGKRRLVLITCDGTFLPEKGTYDERLIVFAELVS